MIVFENTIIGHHQPLISIESLSLQTGAIYALIGRNGAGKSSLMRVVAGIVPPTAGRVEVYGQKMPISQLATVSVPESQMINVQVWDKANVGAVDQAIRTSDLNLNPLVDGQLLRIAIPKLTEERRKELIKVLKTIAEKAKVAIRNIRRDSLEELKKEQKDNNLSEDDLKKNSNEVQKITDLKIAEIDKKLSEKEVEILKV